MADIREIKSRMKSVSDTEKITKAMYMISSSKMRRARAELERTRPHFDALNAEIKRIFRSKTKIDSPYMYPADGSHDIPGAYAYIVVTSDKGLAGYYNHAVINEFEEVRDKEHESRYFIVGDYGCKYCDVRGIPYEGEFKYSADNPSMRVTRNMAEHILTEYDEGRISKIFLIYTDLENGISQKAKTVRLLPFHRKDFTDEKDIPDVSFEFYPSPETVLKNIVRSYVAEYLYSALVDSFCCEQSARMNAMDEADRNAAQLMNDLRLEYNHARQSKITREITEISAGARALKKKRSR